MSYGSVFRPGLFDGQTIIVTGGGSGIGRCIAHELASLSATTVLMGRKEDKLKRVAEEIEEGGGRADYLTVDIRDEARVREVVSETIDRHERIDGLVNNAGGQFPSPLANISHRGFSRVVENNLVGGFLMMREVFEQCMRDHGGSIVNMSAECTNGFPTMGHTGAARAGMENLTKTAAWEWGRVGVRVNAVAPGFIASSGFDTYDPATQAYLRTARNGVPLGRLGNEAEVSSAVAFLLSPAASYFTGHCMHMTGGSELGGAAAVLPLPPAEGVPTDGFDGFHLYRLPDALKD